MLIAQNEDGKLPEETSVSEQINQPVHIKHEEPEHIEQKHNDNGKAVPICGVRRLLQVLIFVVRVSSSSVEPNPNSSKEARSLLYLFVIFANYFLDFVLLVFLVVCM